MIDHTGIAVSDMAVSRAFYEAALKPLGYSVQMEVTEEMTGGQGSHVGFGTPDRPDFWIGTGKAASTGVHVAISAGDQAAVEAFYEAALAAGGKDNGAPGLRPQYHAGYFGAFVLDPDGNNVEAVFHGANPAG